MPDRGRARIEDVMLGWVGREPRGIAPEQAPDDWAPTARHQPRGDGAQISVEQLYGQGALSAVAGFTRWHEIARVIRAAHRSRNDVVCCVRVRIAVRALHAPWRRGARRLTVEFGHDSAAGAVELHEADLEGWIALTGEPVCFNSAASCCVGPLPCDGIPATRGRHITGRAGRLAHADHRP